MLYYKGKDGSEVHTPWGSYSHDGYAVNEEDVVDTVGAGDAFVGGFLSKWLSKPSPKDVNYEKALKIGNWYGAYSVKQEGSINSELPESPI